MSVMSWVYIISGYVSIMLGSLYVVLLFRHKSIWWCENEADADEICASVAIAVFWPLTMPIYVVIKAAEATAKSLKGRDENDD